MSAAQRHQARIAPRSAWQAIDLGTRMYRAWWLPLTGLWLLTTLAPAVVLWWLWPGANSVLGPLLFWWLKPLWERPLLEYCARALFGERSQPLALLRQFPRYGFSHLLAQLTWRRLSPSRSYFAPVFQLEKGSREQVSQRLRILSTPPSAHSGPLTLLVVHLEQGLMLSLLMLAWVLVPWEISLTLEYWLDDQARYLSEIMLVCWYLAMTLLEPLYVCCGFALYLNKRTWLEGWDLEPGLRDIGRRRRPTGTAAVLGLALLLPLFWLAPAAEAGEPAPREQAVNILAGEAFMPMQVEEAWRWKERDGAQGENWLDRFLRWLFDREPSNRERNPQGWGWLADILRLLAWAVLIGAVAWLLWSQRHLLAERRGPQREPGPAPVIRGMSLARETLPADPDGAVREALEQGDLRQALSLLYRLALSELHQRHGLRISAGATEGEVLRQIRQDHADDPLAGFLARLTPVWVSTAWGHRSAAPEQVGALLDDWRQSRRPQPSGGTV